MQLNKKSVKPDDYLKYEPKLDYITFSSSSESTLYLHIDKIVDFSNQKYPEYDTALLVNSSLLSRKEVGFTF